MLFNKYAQIDKAISDSLDKDEKQDILENWFKSAGILERIWGIYLLLSPTISFLLMVVAIVTTSIIAAGLVVVSQFIATIWIYRIDKRWVVKALHTVSLILWVGLLMGLGATKFK